MFRALKPLRHLLVSAAMLPFVFAVPAHAIFGIGDIVLDPSNLAQNVMTATRTLQQVNNQIRMLQNQARHLIEQGLYVGDDLTRTLGEISRLTNEARGLTYRIEYIEQAFQSHFPDAYADWSTTQVAQIADAQRDASRDAYRDTVMMQAQIVQTVQQDTRHLETLVRASQSAPGDLSATQAGNQIAALSAKQSMQMQELMAAQFRAEAIDRSRTLYKEDAARARHAAFMGRNTGLGG